jgi:hypothetical protein
MVRCVSRKQAGRTSGRTEYRKASIVRRPAAQVNRSRCALTDRSSRLEVRGRGHFSAHAPRHTVHASAEKMDLTPVASGSMDGVGVSPSPKRQAAARAGGLTGPENRHGRGRGHLSAHTPRATVHASAEHMDRTPSRQGLAGILVDRAGWLTGRKPSVIILIAQAIGCRVPPPHLIFPASAFNSEFPL